uniref:uncharacterized protein LOC130484762 n=1 Tax=Euleptes europaea TaxID=460621 RepID=UPI0025418194|nr:uncharacterized protein LOC130484762 [Euleptes europaea]
MSEKEETSSIETEQQSNRSPSQLSETDFSTLYPLYTNAEAQTLPVEIPPGNDWRSARLKAAAQVQTSNISLEKSVSLLQGGMLQPSKLKSEKSEMLAEELESPLAIKENILPSKPMETGIQTSGPEIQGEDKQSLSQHYDYQFQPSTIELLKKLSFLSQIETMESTSRTELLKKVSSLSVNDPQAQTSIYELQRKPSALSDSAAQGQVLNVELLKERLSSAQVTASSDYERAGKLLLPSPAKEVQIQTSDPELMKMSSSSHTVTQGETSEADLRKYSSLSLIEAMDGNQEEITEGREYLITPQLIESQIRKWYHEFPEVQTASQAPARREPLLSLTADSEVQTSSFEIPQGNRWRASRLQANAEVQTSEREPTAEEVKPCHQSWDKAETQTSLLDIWRSRDLADAQFQTSDLGLATTEVEPPPPLKESAPQLRSDLRKHRRLSEEKPLMASAVASAAAVQTCLLVFQLALAGNVLGGRVLIWPTEASHWLNIKIIIEEMIERGHNISVLVSTASLFIQPGDVPAARFELYPVPFGKEDLDSLIQDIVMLWLHNRPTTLTFHQFYKELGKLVKKANVLNKQMCDGVLANQDLLVRLQKSHFDVLLADPVTICGDLVALKLGIPFVYTLRFTPAFTVERHCGMIPALPSYVPAVLSELTDRMSFGERIKNTLSYQVQDYVFQSYWGEWDSYYSHILADNSHWINLKVIMEELTARGHRVTVLLPSYFQITDSNQPSPFHLEEVTVPFPKAEMDALLLKILHMSLYEQPKMSLWEFSSTFYGLAVELISKNKILCDTVVLNEKLMKKLQSSGFDLLIADPLMPGGELVAEKLRIPFVYSLRFSLGNTVERLCGGLPAPPSYVPAATSGLVDRMSFTERMKNLLLYISLDFIFHQVLVGDWNQYYSDVLGRPTTLCETMGKAELWLIRTYWDFEFPRPLLPNFEFVGGLHCKPAKPLPEEIEEFVQSSGEHGIVVFSLGSMVHNLTDEKSNMIASALSQIPQKVLWRYKGKRPETLGSNTRLYDWIPQNDLLGHPKTKAFITHGGTNGIYEAIYHGIPMVGIPLFADQHDNIVHMSAKGMAVDLNFHTMTAQDLVEAVKAVIHNSTYKENAVRLSQIHHDQPIKPLDRAIFWIEFIMRHKSAKHLRPAAHHLNWYQYHCLDVLAFLTVCAAVFVFIAVKCCVFCCWKCGRVIKKRKTE